MSSGLLELAVRGCAAGVGATVLIDLWALLLHRGLGLPALDWAMVGRWIGHLPRGAWRHARIADAPAIRGERALGWSAHYLVGVVFATALLAVMGARWAAAPTLWPCLATGWLTIAFPFLLMQPALGAGIAAARTPHPARARLQSLATHTVFGFGLYASVRCLAALLPPPLA